MQNFTGVSGKVRDPEWNPCDGLTPHSKEIL